MDIVFEPPAPGRYRVLIAPALRLMDEDWAGRLRRFVEGGGTLVATVCTATLNRDHVAPDEPVPWGLTDVFGVRRVEWSSLSKMVAPPKERLGEGAAAWEHLRRPDAIPVIAGGGPLAGRCSADTWCDHLRATTAEVWARFAPGSPPGESPAITCNRFGAGRAVYVAAVMEQRLNDRLMEALAGRAGDAPSSESAGVEIVRFEMDSRPAFFLLNHGASPATVRLAGKAADLISGASVSDSIVLAPYDVAVVATHGEKRG